MEKDNIRRVLATNTFKLMKALDLSAVDVARRSGGGIVNRSVGYVLKEERSIGIDALEGLAKAFRVQPGVLLTKLSDNDIEHIKLLSTLSEEEKKDVCKYASFLIEKRDHPDADS